MNVNSPEYRHMMAQIPLELIHKTQAAKEIQMNVVENIRNRTAQMVKAPQEALAQSYDGHAGTYGSNGKKTHIPQFSPQKVDVSA
jgi:hypothetical protein